MKSASHLPATGAGLPDRGRRAIREAFGSRTIDAVHPTGGGLSGGEAFRLQVSDRSYLLKLERSADGFNDPARQHLCLAAAAEAGLAPKLFFADAASGVSISDFIVARPLDEHPGGRAGLLRALGDMVRRLQALAPFPPLIDFPDGVALLVGRAATLGGLSPEQADEARARLDEIRGVLGGRPHSLVASHNDLNPRNVLFDGERLWLIDWEAAFRNDAYIDPAILANFFARNDEEEAMLMRGYLGRDATGAETAGLLLARQLCRLYYAAILTASAAGPPHGPPVETAGPDLASAQGRLRYGRSILDEMLSACRSPAYLRALERGLA